MAKLVVSENVCRDGRAQVGRLKERYDLDIVYGSAPKMRRS